ncbi:hypothetical protein [Vibrio furnissii]|uniref:hypothetical protein n=1 Tax=Vibrio furnissii TaxID=29494 RepID=UPI001EEB2158|nr:hypothetical protein [Vibrio furnissii]
MYNKNAKFMGFILTTNSSKAQENDQLGNFYSRQQEQDVSDPERQDNDISKEEDHSKEDNVASETVLRCSALVSAVVPIYIAIYSIGTVWLLFDGWISNFSSLHSLWSVQEGDEFPTVVVSLLFTILGAILGGTLLGVTSFHRYQAIEKSFDADHIWGFILAPLLAIAVGILSFVIIQSGLIVLSGGISDKTDSITSSLGYIAIGSISLYNWDVFVGKMKDWSKNILSTKDDSSEGNQK